MSGERRKAVRAVVSGRVQGVFFRGWTVRMAEARGLDGWVRNRRDGTVEALFAGPADAVGHMLADCWNGPDPACVTDVAVTQAEDPGTTGFDQVPTV
ncbi:MAG: acylphosphatase [Inquilinus sp.]|nr:acylphosphatase [Inquilinus sp.]